MRRLFVIIVSIIFIVLWLTLRPPMRLQAPSPNQTTQAITDINLITQSWDKFTSVVPQGWYDAGGGAFAYDDTDYAIVQRAILAPSVDFVQPSMRNDLNLTSENFIQEQNHHDLAWQMYRGTSPDFEVAYALANGGDLTVYLVLLQAPKVHFDTLYNNLFLEALATFEPR